MAPPFLPHSSYLKGWAARSYIWDPQRDLKSGVPSWALLPPLKPAPMLPLWLYRTGPLLVQPGFWGPWAFSAPCTSFMKSEIPQEEERLLDGTCKYPSHYYPQVWGTGKVKRLSAEGTGHRKARPDAGMLSKSSGHGQVWLSRAVLQQSNTGSFQ